MPTPSGWRRICSARVTFQFERAGPAGIDYRPRRRRRLPMQDSTAPFTLEGWNLLHQIFRVRWTEWKRLSADRRREVAAEAARLLGEMERRADGASCAVRL